MMLVKYQMQDKDDNRGNVKLITQGTDGVSTAYSKVETQDADMTELTQSEIDFVASKAGENWDDYRTSLKVKIDQLADRVRRSHLEVGQSIDIEYNQVRLALNEWRDAGSPTDDVPDEILVWKEVTGNTLTWAVDDIQAAIDNYRNILAQIRRRRLEGKAALDAAAAVDLLTTYNDYYSQIDALMAGT